MQTRLHLLSAKVVVLDAILFASMFWDVFATGSTRHQCLYQTTAVLHPVQNLGANFPGSQAQLILVWLDTGASIFHYQSKYDLFTWFPFLLSFSSISLGRE